MSLMKPLRRVPLALAVLVLASAAFMSAALYHVSAVPNEKGVISSTPCGTVEKQKLNEELRRGVGSEVQFASANDSSVLVVASVESAADFIYERSNLRMSDDTKKRLIDAEEGVLGGTGRRLSIEDMTDSLCNAVVARLATLTDDEVKQAADTYATPQGGIFTRACGKWGMFTKDEFTERVQAARVLSRAGNSAVRAGLRPFIEEEVIERTSYLSEALPDRFGNVKTNGVTPLQALLIVYSVAADDGLKGSRSDIAQNVVQKRMDAKQTRAEKKAQNRDFGRPYGVNGLLYSSPVHLLLNKETVTNLLSFAEGGGKK